MAEKNRNFSIYLLVLALIGTAVFYGCGGGVSEDQIPALEYSIVGKYETPMPSSNVATTRANTTSNGGVYGPSYDIFIYSEADPTNYAYINQTNNTFVISKLKANIKHNIVFGYKKKILDSGYEYITRSDENIELSNDRPSQEVKLSLKPTRTEKSVSGKLVGINGSPVPFGNAKLTLWGQEINVDANGNFTTPKMPLGLTADLIVSGLNYKNTSTPVKFEENAAYREITAVETTVNPVPPTVNLVSSKYTCNTEDYIVLQAFAENPNGNNLIYNWSIEPEIYKSTLKADSGSDSLYTWISPNKDTTATITVEVKDQSYTGVQLSAKAMVCIKVGSGYSRENTPPVIKDITIFPSYISGDRDYTIVCNATDADNDVLYYTWDLPKDGGKYTRDGANSIVWHTPDIKSTTSFEITVTVNDGRENGKVSRSQVFTVNPTEPNNAPKIQETYAESESVISNQTVSFRIVATDDKYEKLTFSWSSDGGRIIESSFADNIVSAEASATWKAPILSSPATKHVYVSVKDPRGARSVATFSIDVTPDPSLRPPTIKFLEPAPDQLFNLDEVITFKAEATDVQKGEKISAENFVWEISTLDGAFTTHASNVDTTTVTFTKNSECGTYTMRLFVTDYSNITGENEIKFCINSKPTMTIDCNGNKVDPATGRMQPNSQYTYNVDGKDYDVFQNATDTITLTAWCEDPETPVSVLEANTTWIYDGSVTTGKVFNLPAPLVRGIHSISYFTTDIASIKSDVATYTFFVNEAPVFEVATSTKSGYVYDDVISMNATVTDDTEGGITLTWYYKNKAKSVAEWPESYTIYNVPNNPYKSTTNKLVSPDMSIKATDLIDKIGDGDYRFMLYAEDSMGRHTVDESIGFSIVDTHHINDFIVASGAYSPDFVDYTSFDKLPLASQPYVFGGTQPFSIKSGSDIWQDDMTWTWSDAVWTNGKVGDFTKIDDKFTKDGYILNGYDSGNVFGTHTIRLEGKSNTYGVIASNSVDVLINSTPGIEFVNVSEEGIVRFDTDGDAEFTLSVTEDDRNERLGLRWAVVPLDENLNEIESQRKTFVSHDLDSSTSSIAPISMGGQNQKNVVVNLKDVADAPALASGALRVYAYVYDAFGAESLASVDVLVNRLPTFNKIDGNRCVKITIPDESPDGEDYSEFKNQYATATPDVPVFLTEGNPSMYINLTAEGFDYELDKSGIDINTYNGGKNIVWTYTGTDGKPMTQTGPSIGGRFSIGKNTVRVEIRDSFYGKYNNRFNDLASATYTADFYIWHSYSQDLYIDDRFTAVDMIPANENDGVYYIQIKDLTGDELPTYTYLYQIVAGGATTIDWIHPGVHETDFGEYTGAPPAPKVFVATHSPGILAVMPTPRNESGKLAMITDTIHKPLSGPDNYVTYGGGSSSESEYNSAYIATNTIVYQNSYENNDSKTLLSNFGQNFPDNDWSFPRHITNVAVAGNNSGAMLIRDWKSADWICLSHFYIVR